MGQMAVFMRGTRVVAQVTFRVPATEAGTPTDPTTAVFTARKRDAAATAYVYGAHPEVTRVSTGVYEWAKKPDPGEWYLHVQGTAAAWDASDEVWFQISESYALS